jgi:hypothetical protein
MSNRTLRNTQEYVAATSGGDNSDRGCRRLLVRLGFALSAALVAGTLAVGMLMPPIVVLAILFLVGARWSRQSPKAGPILIAILAALLLSLNAGLMIEAAAVPASPVDFL